MTKFLNISTDNTLGGNSPSDDTVSSQKAIKAYVDSQTGTAPAFANITGQPTDNANLASALNAKYDASNPNGYTSNVGTVTSVNNVSPVNGNVTLSIPTVNNATLTITQGGTTKGTFTANANSDVTIALDAGGGGSVDIDNKSITTNSSDEIQTVGVINSRDSSTAIKTWTGTRQQYDAIVTKDANTLYNVTDSIYEEELQLSNPFSLLDYKFSEYEISNASWLRSNGQYNSGTTYADVYNLLLQIYNGTVTKAGVSVKLSTETYADTDFVLNTSDTTFRLPTKVALASGKAVAGNGKTLGLTNGTVNTGVYVTGDGDIVGRTGIYGANVGQSDSGTTPYASTSIGITTDPTKSGIETSANGLYLYFYVGAVIQDASVIAAASVLNDVANLKSGYYLPDYSQGIDISSSITTGYTALKQGIVMFYTMPATGALTLTINNNTIVNKASTSGQYAVGLSIPVDVNDVIKSSVFSGGSAMFFPFKGAN